MAPKPKRTSDVGRFRDSDWQSLPQDVKTWIANGESDVYRRARSNSIG